MKQALALIKSNFLELIKNKTKNLDSKSIMVNEIWTIFSMLPHDVSIILREELCH